MSWTLKQRLCLNDLPVPFREERLEFEDLRKILDEDFDSELDVSLLSLKSIRNLQFLMKAFDLGAKWWRVHSLSLPLVTEIREAIDGGKTKKGGGSRLPRRSKILVAIEVRSKKILVVNQANGIQLAFRKGEEMEGLQRFLEEFSKDLETVGKNPKKRPREPEDEDSAEESQEDEHEVDNDMSEKAL